MQSSQNVEHVNVWDRARQMAEANGVPSQYPLVEAMLMAELRRIQLRRAIARVKELRDHAADLTT